MIVTRTLSRFGLILLLAIGCAPDLAEQSQWAQLDDDVVNYVPADRSIEIRAALAQPEVMEMPEDILEIAIAEEGKSLEQVGVSTGFPLSTYAGAAAGGWCSEFVAWSYWRGGCPFTGQRGSYPWMIGGSTQIRQWFLTNSRFVYQTDAEWASYEPQPGDYIRYNNPEGGHSGIVRYADGTTLYTVEGNVNSKVMLRSLRNYKTAYADPADGIDGFGVMTPAQCGASNGAGGAAGTTGSTGADGGAGSTGTGGRGATGGASGSAGPGGRGGGGDAGTTAGAGGGAGDGGSTGATGSGGRTGRRGTGGMSGGSTGTGGASSTAAAGGSAGGAASTAGAGGTSASGGSRAGQGGSAGSGGVAGVSGSSGAAGGAPGAGGTSAGASTTTAAGGSSTASVPAAASTNGCSCSIERGVDARHGLWLVGLAFLWAAYHRRRR